ncbi:MAG: hypothetical protein IJO08_04520 [Clostridia bacterium]|nr:hypothetical protein [Clostridia bacterium]
MKKNVWIGILGVGTVIYIVLQILTSIPVIGYIGAVVLAALGFKTVVEVLEYKEQQKALLESEAERLQLEAKKSDEYDRCMNEIEEIVYDYRYLSPYRDRIIKQFEDFNSKEKGLRKIIDYNNNNSEAFITSKSNSVREYLLRNLKRFTKCMLAYSVTHKKNEEATNVKALDDILDASQELIDWYDKLIIEVARMHDNFNEDDADLQSLVDNLKQLRLANETEDDGDDDPFN